MRRYYLDHNATTPLHPRVKAEMSRLLDETLGNPSSLHEPGRQARRIIEQARERVASALGADLGELYFTSGGTESNNLLIHGAFGAFAEPGSQLFVGALEHPSVWEPAVAHWGSPRPTPEQGGVVAVDDHGMLQPADQVLAQRSVESNEDRTHWVSLQWINNETGHRQDIAAHARGWRNHGFKVHTDGAQGFFRCSTRLTDLDVDAATVTAHKSFGPVGVGVLYLRRGLALEPTLQGGPQERLLRPGTENLLAIHGLGVLAELSTQEELWPEDHLSALQAAFRNELDRVSELQFVAGEAETYPSVCTVTLPDLPAEAVLAQLDRRGVAASSGAACSSGSRRPSRVLQALGVVDPHLSGPIRFSWGPDFQLEDVSEVARRFRQVVDELRRSSPARR